MSNLNRTFCPAVKGAAPLDARVLGPWLNQPRCCLATGPAHVPSSLSARMGFGCQAPVTINSCQLGKACFSNQHRKQLTPCGRDGTGAAGRLGSGAPGAPARLSLRPQEGLRQGPGKLLGWGGFFAPQGLCQAPWAETRVGPLRGSAQRVTPAYLPAHGSWGGRRAQVACPRPLCRPLRLSQRLLGPRRCGRSHRKGRGAADRSRGDHSASTRHMGRPPVSSRAYPRSPPATLRPIPHPALGPGPPTLPSSQRACSRGFWEQRL